MNPTLPNNLAVDRKLRTFLIESGDFFRVREWRNAESEAVLHEDIKKHEPWKLPVTIVEVE